MGESEEKDPQKSVVRRKGRRRPSGAPGGVRGRTRDHPLRPSVPLVFYPFLHFGTHGTVPKFMKLPRVVSGLTMGNLEVSIKKFQQTLLFWALLLRWNLNRPWKNKTFN